MPETKFIETEALIAAMNDDQEQLYKELRKMSGSERNALKGSLYMVMDAIDYLRYKDTDDDV